MRFYYYYSLFIEEKTEAQKLCVILLRLPSWERQNYDGSTKYGPWALEPVLVTMAPDCLPLCSAYYIFVVLAVLL